MDFSNGTNATTESYRWIFLYGRIKYNHKLNYENTDNIYNGPSPEGNYNEWTRNSSNSKYENYHSMTLIFSNFIILSCTIWYCVTYDTVSGTDAANQSFSNLYIYAHIKFNHFLNYGNNSNIRNGDWGDNNEWNTGNVKYENWHSTTFLFGNVS